MTWMETLAATAKQAVTLVCDPQADDSERWLVEIGLDWIGVGPIPQPAATLRL